jgi:hypothetical protein
MPSADQVPVKTSHSTMRWHMWVFLIAGSTGSALRAVRPPNLHIAPDVGTISLRRECDGVPASRTRSIRFRHRDRRIWKATIAARLCSVEVEVRGASPRELSQWLWDFDARPIADLPSEMLASTERTGRIGFADELSRLLSVQSRASDLVQASNVASRRF